MGAIKLQITESVVFSLHARYASQVSGRLPYTKGCRSASLRIRLQEHRRHVIAKMNICPENVRVRFSHIGMLEANSLYLSWS